MRGCLLGLICTKPYDLTISCRRREYYVSEIYLVSLQTWNGDESSIKTFKATRYQSIITPKPLNTTSKRDKYGLKTSIQACMHSFCFLSSQ